jgi:hypothetical protein
MPLHEGMWESGGLVVSCFVLWGMSLGVISGKGLGGPHSLSGCFGEVLCQELNPDSSVMELLV